MIYRKCSCRRSFQKCRYSKLSHADEDARESTQPHRFYCQGARSVLCRTPRNSWLRGGTLGRLRGGAGEPDGTGGQRANERHFNKVDLVKRLMYGQGKIDLLASRARQTPPSLAIAAPRALHLGRRWVRVVPCRRVEDDLAQAWRTSATSAKGIMLRRVWQNRRGDHGLGFRQQDRLRALSIRRHVHYSFLRKGAMVILVCTCSPRSRQEQDNDGAQKIRRRTH